MINKAIGYCRVSTIGQAEDGCSLSMQEDKIKAYCKLNDLQLTKIITDAGKSGTNMEREGLEQVKSIVENGEIKHVIFYKLDRMARNLRGAIEFSDFLQHHNTQLHSICEKIDTTTPAGRLFFTIINALSAFEAEQIKARVKDALQSKKARGEVYNHVQYGYSLTEDGKHITINPIEQKVIKRIRRYHAKGFSYNKIARELNKSNIHTKLGKDWQAIQVRRVLKSA